MVRHFARPHVGKIPMKFYFRAQDISVSLPGVDIAGKLVLVWKRGPRRTTTEPFAIKETLSSIDGSLSRTATTTQDLALICTMFKVALPIFPRKKFVPLSSHSHDACSSCCNTTSQTRAGAFETKAASFSLMEESPEGSERKLGTASIDLASYATPEKSTDSVELSFLDGKIRLRLTLSSHWLKQMNAEVDDDGASVSSVGSFASSAALGNSGDDLDDLSDAQGTLLQRGGTGSANGGSGHGGGHGGGGHGGGACSSSEHGSAEASAPPLPPYATDRERSDAARNAAIEKRWKEEAGRAQSQDELSKMREEVAEAREARLKAEKEAKALKGRVERLQHENRVLRKEQRGGKRDEVVLQLETELAAKEQERAEMEENLSKAFGGVIAEAHERIHMLTTERDGLMVKLEEATHGHGKKGGLFSGK